MDTGAVWADAGRGMPARWSDMQRTHGWMLHQLHQLHPDVGGGVVQGASAPRPDLSPCTKPAY